MRNKVVLLYVLIFCIFMAEKGFSFYGSHAAQDTNDLTTNRIVIKINPALKVNLSANKSGLPVTGIAAIDNVFEGHKVQDIKPLKKKASIDQTSEILKNIFILQIHQDKNPEEFISECSSIDNVVYAHIDYIAQLHDVPNDPLYVHQWSLNNTGQACHAVEQFDNCGNDYLTTASGTVDADIDAEEVISAPAQTTETVVVGVLDTGVDMDHPELAGKIWQNTDEIDGNGIDDDHNGYIDDISGWDFCGTNSLPIIADNDPTDEHGHGTHCSGIIAAVRNNNIGISGLTDDVLIMPLKFAPVMLSSFAAQAIIYAADNGADVVSMSFGYPWAVPVLDDAVAYARSKGVICCASSGNDGYEKLNYPAASPGVLTIGATNNSDLVTYFSTYGPHLEFVAPGKSVLSLRADETDMYAPCEDNVHIIDDEYYLASGTSMSCPTVAGIIAGMLTVSPGMTESATITALIASVDDITQPYGSGNYPGYDIFSGYGKVNYYNAMRQLPDIRAKILSHDNNHIVSGTVAIFGIADGDQFSGYTLEYGLGHEPEEWIVIEEGFSPVTDGVLGNWNTSLLNGTYTVRLRVGAYNNDQVSLYVINNTIAQIDNINPDDTLDSWMNITGSAICPDFVKYTLEYESVSVPGMWNMIHESSIPVYNGLLCDWNPVNLLQGNYSLRLSVHSGSGAEDSSKINVYVRSIYMSERAWKVTLPYDLAPMANYGDFDNDGVNEIIVGTSDGVKFFNLDGTEKTENVPTTTEFDTWIPIAVGNLDGDDIDDFVFIDKLSSGRMFGISSGNPPFNINLHRQPDYSQVNNGGEQYYPYLSLKDIDNDNRDEIIVGTGGTSPYYTIYESDGSVLYVLYQSFPGFYTYLSLDVDGDNIDEFFMAGKDNIAEVSKPYGYKINTTDWTVGTTFQPQFMSAADVDSDGQREIVVLGVDNNDGGTYWIYAFEGDLTPVPGWPRDTHINNYIISSPVYFGDVDTDETMEYFLSVFEISTSNVFAWHSDGVPLLGDTLQAVLCGPENPSKTRGPIISDIDGDGFPDIVANANPDLYYTYDVSRLAAWDKNGEALPGFPIITCPDSVTKENFWIHAPVVGDIDKDGVVDVLLTTYANDLIFINFPGGYYDANRTPVQTWKYNRRLNNMGPVKLLEFICADVNVDGDINLIDVLYLIEYIYGIPPGPAPLPLESGDINNDNEINLLDILYLIDFIYGIPSGPEPDCEA